MAHRSKNLYPTILAGLVLAMATGAAAAATVTDPGELLRAWSAAASTRGVAVPRASYELAVGDWRGIPGRSWTDAEAHRIYLSPELRHEAQDARFPQGRREMRLQLLHELGHLLDAELTDDERGTYAAIMKDFRPWFGTDPDQVDAEQPPSERFAVAYAAVAAGLRYDRLRADYGFGPTRGQYRQLGRYFRALAERS